MYYSFQLFLLFCTDDEFSSDKLVYSVALEWVVHALFSIIHTIVTVDYYFPLYSLMNDPSLRLTFCCWIEWYSFDLTATQPYTKKITFRCDADDTLLL